MVFTKFWRVDNNKNLTKQNLLCGICAGLQDDQKQHRCTSPEKNSADLKQLPDIVQPSAGACWVSQEEVGWAAGERVRPLRVSLECEMFCKTRKWTLLYDHLGGVGKPTNRQREGEKLAGSWALRTFLGYFCSRARRICWLLSAKTCAQPKNLRFKDCMCDILWAAEIIFWPEKASCLGLDWGSGVCSSRRRRSFASL